VFSVLSGRRGSGKGERGGTLGCKRPTLRVFRIRGGLGDVQGGGCGGKPEETDRYSGDVFVFVKEKTGYL